MNCARHLLPPEQSSCSPGPLASGHRALVAALSPPAAPACSQLRLYPLPRALPGGPGSGGRLLRACNPPCRALYFPQQPRLTAGDTYTPPPALARPCHSAQATPKVTTNTIACLVTSGPQNQPKHICTLETKSLHDFVLTGVFLSRPPVTETWTCRCPFAPQSRQRHPCTQRRGPSRAPRCLRREARPARRPCITTAFAL